VSFKELGLDSIDRIELDAMVEQKFNIVIIDYDTESIKDMTDLVYKIITEGYGK
jgi:acyl carrier protein